MSLIYMGPIGLVSCELGEYSEHYVYTHIITTETKSSRRSDPSVSPFVDRQLVSHESKRQRYDRCDVSEWTSY